jgi:hypothetical protein
MTVVCDGNIHVMPDWEPFHVESKDCPCHPRLSPTQDTVQLVYVHRAACEEGN